MINTYSWLQRQLHNLVLSSAFMREVTFDLESSFFCIQNSNAHEHIFISGQARSGTTALLNALYASGEFASLTYADMPFVLAPNLWSKLSASNRHNNEIERAHGDKVMVSQTSPEAFEEVFWQTFAHTQPGTSKKFACFVQAVMARHQRQRYISKNNHNYRRLQYLCELYPQSQVLLTFRKPCQQANSLLNQHQRFIAQSQQDPFIARYMQLTAHTEFGPHYSPVFKEQLKFADSFDINHWLEQWLLTYQKLYTDISHLKNAHLVCYECLCHSPSTWEKLQTLTNSNQTQRWEFKESLKPIPAAIDPVLLKQCQSLYKALKQQAI